MAEPPAPRNQAKEPSGFCRLFKRAAPRRTCSSSRVRLPAAGLPVARSAANASIAGRKRCTVCSTQP
jgi:hypothetical protein